MSDEQTPAASALRLKPRLRPAEANPTAATPSVPAGAPASPPAVEAPRFYPPVATVPPAVVNPPPAVIPPPAPPPTTEPQAPGETVKFKFKPKVTPPAEVAAPTPAAETPVIPAVILPTPSSPAGTSPPIARATIPPDLTPGPVIGSKQGLYVTGNTPKPGKTPPPFPVVLPARAGTTMPPMPVPHLNIQSPVMEELDSSSSAAPKSTRRPLVIVAAVAVLAVGAFFGWRQFRSKPTAPEKPVATAPAPATAPTTSSVPSPTPSDTPNKTAEAPTKAIGVAPDTNAPRPAGVPLRAEPVTAANSIPDRSTQEPPAPAARPVTEQPPQTMTQVAPGLSASAPLDAGVNASSDFRLYVANLKIAGVFQGEPPRAVINGKLTRVGERLDAELGVIFAGLDAERHRLIFKDRSGATVQRKY